MAYKQPTVALLNLLKSTNSTKLLKKLLMWSHSTEGFDDSLETCEIEMCSVSEPVFEHNSFNCARDVHHKKCGLGLKY